MIGVQSWTELNHLLFNVVSRKHSHLASAFNASIHPTAVNRVHLEDQITFNEAHLVFVLSFVIVNCSINALKLKSFNKLHNLDKLHDSPLYSSTWPALAIVGDCCIEAEIEFADVAAAVVVAVVAAVEAFVAAFVSVELGDAVVPNIAVVA